MSQSFLSVSKAHQLVGLPWSLRVWHWLLRDWQEGQLVIEYRQHSLTVGQTGQTVRLSVHRPWRSLGLLWMKGVIGFAQGYELGYLEVSELTRLMVLVQNNQRSLGKLRLTNWHPYQWYLRWRHLKRDNTAEGGSRRNISAHYDLGNDFYRAWLDDSMSYSSAHFQHDEQGLPVAQKQKLDRILAQLALSEGDHVLEIGCGWGGLVSALLENQHRLTALTLSSEQKDYVDSTFSEAVSQGALSILLEDYRLHQQSYDAIVSIEMFEAVGERWWSTYFARVADNLKDQGRFVMQSITIADAVYPAYRQQPDFIQHRIFPGGMLPTVAHIERLAEAAGLALVDRFDFGLDYAKTLKCWRDNFVQAWSELENMGLHVTFLRRWYFYLSYCEAGFLTSRTSVHQFTFVKSSAQQWAGA